MVNERITENIVRKHFTQFENDCLIEEQKSASPKIDKLLKNASKKGDQCGYPEFIISFKDYPKLLIIVECKAETSKHESMTRDKYAEYAVDGVLLYSSFLSKEFDVLTIAVSGQNKRELKVSHFLQLCSEHKAKEIFGNEFLDIESYLNGYLQAPQKVNQDYNKLLKFSKELNEQLHSYKIVESKRSLLLSGILIASENKPFKKAYIEYDKPEDLAEYLVSTVSSELKKSNVQGKKLDNLKLQYSFIKTDTTLARKKHVLRDLVTSIDKNINDFKKSHEYYDVLGQLYTEFLRYANSEKGLGIVLTPPHITELFADFACVDKNSVAYDNCAGTGGFLISAMNKMVQDAHGDLNIIRKIKEKQIIGVEYQSHIFALVWSNMYIHQDGKANMINDNCFDQEVIKEVKKFKPTVGFLNPPYKADKKKDTEELEFVLNNLECIEKVGTCIAIVPMQSALAQREKIFRLKEKLLEKHTLEAVLSMPNELFFNSKTNVVSCVMIFTAHKQHPKNKETYFGYYKDDGFVKRKGKGRIDAFLRWKEIKNKWVSNYLNRKEKAGLSVNKIVTAKDEWCAEAYMKTDYEKLNNSHFEETILNYSSFLFLNKLSFEVSNKAFSKHIISLNIKNWQFFELKSLFTIAGSKTTPVLELEEYGKGKYPYVTTQATNNGIEGFYDYYTEDGEVITFDSAVIGYCSYQPLPFSASDHVEKLIAKFKMNKYIALFLVTVFNQEQYRYNYGRKCSQIRMRKIKIKLPSKNGKPDFEFMEDYIKSLSYSNSI